MNAHKFTADKGSKTCNVCGKTRNAKAHKEAAADSKVLGDIVGAEGNMVDTGMTEDEADAAVAEAEIAEEEVAKAEPWGIPPVPDFVPSAGVEKDVAAEAEGRLTPAEVKAARKADLAAQTAEKAPAAKPAKKAAAKKAEAPTIRIWVGWRISNAAVLEKTTVAAKLREAKPNSELDRFVRLTVEELRTLDAVAVKFEAQGNTGPAVYSARTLRRRIAEAVAKLEADTKENDK